MKKCFIILLIMTILFTLSVNTFAASDTDKSEKSQSDIEISFKVGDDTIKMNGKDVQVEKPLVVNGTTLVPLRVITEAFGAQVDWKAEDKSITLTYSGVTIILHIDSKDAIIDGQSTTMLEPPIIVNGKTMVPLRFITENFGADVKFDDATKTVNVTKHISSENSIKDFSLILKKTSKEKIGDSYYNWTMALPKKFKLEERNFNGTYTVFKTDDEKYELNIYIKDLNNDNLDTYVQKALGYAKDGTIMDQGKKVRDDVEFYSIVYKFSDYTYNDSYFVKDGYVYNVYLKADNDKYKADKEIVGMLNTFTLKYEKDQSVEDLSDITADGFRVFENKKLKFSLNLPADWFRLDDKDKPNEIIFYKRSASIEDRTNLVVMRMYSIDEGVSLASWVEKDVQVEKNKYNPDLLKIESTSDTTINGYPAKLIVSKLKGSKGDIYMEDYYVYGKNYKYHIFYNINADTDKDATKKAVVQDIIKSFKFTEPNADDIGKLIDPKMIPKIVSTKKLESKQYKWSCSIPSSWEEGKDNNDSDNVVYLDSDNDWYFTIDVSKMENTAMTDIVKNYEANLDDSKKFGKIVKSSRSILTVDGVDVYRYEVESKSDNENYYLIQYAFKKDGNLYIVSFGTSEEHYTQNFKLQVETVWKSFQHN